MLLGAGGAVVALTVVLILAVTFLGSTEATSKFASVDGAVGLGGDADPIETTTTTVPIDTDLSAAAWTRYAADDGSFSIEFPVPTPTVDDTPSTDPGIVANRTITAELDHTVYVLNYVELSPDYYFPDPTEVMKLEIDAMGEAFEIAYSSETRDTFGLLPARTFTGSMDNGEGTVQGITFVTEQRAYFLMTVAYDRVLVDHDRFVNSFSAG